MMIDQLNLPIVSNCNICEKIINFNDVNQNKENVLILSYYNCNEIICSIECKEKFEKLVSKSFITPLCNGCGTICTSNKWTFELKFVEHGGWIIRTYMCSEKCRKEQTRKIKKDVNFSMLNQCAFCKDHIINDLKKCSRCKITYYCNQNCQKSDWSKHKINCK